MMTKTKITTDLPKVNGEYYPLWQAFVDRKEEWIGKRLVEQPDRDVVALGGPNFEIETKITDIELVPNGKESAFFWVRGKNFNCGFDVQVGGVGAGKPGWVTFYGYGGHTFAIENP